MLQKWNWAHRFRPPQLPNTRYALKLHEFRGLKAEGEEYPETEVHVDGCNLMFDWAGAGIAGTFSRLCAFVEECESIQLSPIVYFDFQNGGNMADRKYDERLKQRMRENDNRIPVHFTALLGWMFERLGVRVRYVSGVADAAIFNEAKRTLLAGGRAIVYSRDWGFVFASQRESDVRVKVLRSMGGRMDACARCEWGTCVTIPEQLMDAIRAEWKPSIMAQVYTLLPEPWAAMKETLLSTKTLRVRHEHRRSDDMKYTMLGRMTPLYGALATLLDIPCLHVKQPRLTAGGKVVQRIFTVGKEDTSAKVVRKLETMPSALVDKKLIDAASAGVPKAIDLMMETWMVVCLLHGGESGCAFVSWLLAR